MADADGELTHLDERGAARMVDVGAKGETEREAIARAEVRMLPATRDRIFEGGVAKGDVLAAARIAGIQAAKRTSELIPLCHALRITKVEVRFQIGSDPGVLEIEAVVRALDRTGVEMEALTAAAIAALTVYDMCKAVDRWMVIGALRLEEKRGGRSGELRRPDAGSGGLSRGGGAGPA